MQYLCRFYRRVAWLCDPSRDNLVISQDLRRQLDAHVNDKPSGITTSAVGCQTECGSAVTVARTRPTPWPASSPNGLISTRSGQLTPLPSTAVEHMVEPFYGEPNLATAPFAAIRAPNGCSALVSPAVSHSAHSGANDAASTTLAGTGALFPLDGGTASTAEGDTTVRAPGSAGEEAFAASANARRSGGMSASSVAMAREQLGADGGKRGFPCGILGSAEAEGEGNRSSDGDVDSDRGGAEAESARNAGGDDSFSQDEPAPAQPSFVPPEALVALQKQVGYA